MLKATIDLSSRPPGLKEDESRGKTARQVTRAAGVVSAATLASRLFGYLRDVVVAGFFGAGMASDAFFIAFSIPNLMRRLFAEGSLSIAFIPVFASHLSRYGRQEALRLANSVLRLTALSVTIFCGICILLAPWIVQLMAYGWTEFPEKIALCIRLTQWMMPYMIFISLVAISMGILNVFGHFWAPALSPVFLNIAMIAAVVVAAWFTPSESIRISALAWGVVIGGAVQLFIQLPFLARKGAGLFKTGPLWHPGINQILKMMGPALFGAGIYQINTLVIRFLASLLPQGSVSYLYYADRLVQFPLGMFAIATATALLPALSRQAALGQWEDLRATFTHAMGFVFFFTLPCMVGLLVLREPIVALLFQRGAFDAATMRLTSDALLYYGVGLWAFSAVRIVLNLFYALQDTWTPLWTGLLAVAANFLFSLLFMGPLRHNGLALALSMASTLNLVLLMLVLRRRLKGLKWRSLAISCAMSLFCAVLMGLAVRGLASYMVYPLDSISRLRLMIGVTICIAAGAAVFIGLAAVFKLPELQTARMVLTRKSVGK